MATATPFKNSGKMKLVSQQNQDTSLDKIRKWAERGELKYGYMDEVLVHTQEDDGGQEFVQIVVPTERRRQLHVHVHGLHLPMPQIQLVISQNERQ